MATFRTIPVQYNRSYVPPGIRSVTSATKGHTMQIQGQPATRASKAVLQDAAQVRAMSSF